MGDKRIEVIKEALDKKDKKPMVTAAILYDNGDVKTFAEIEKKRKQEKNFGDAQTDKIIEAQGALRGIKDTMNPPYALETLAKLSLMNTWHSKCINTKATDVVGKGHRIELIEGMAENKKQKDDLKLFIETAAEEGRTFDEITTNWVVDRLNDGNGAIEIGRDKTQIPALYAHIPFYTLRVHKDNKRWVHTVDNKFKWFKRFGVKQEYDKDTGLEIPAFDFEKSAHELLLLQNYTSLSSYYGIPEIIPAIGAIIASKYAREFNMQFFENNAIPRFVVIITGGKVTSAVRGMIRDYFTREIKKNSHSTLIIEIPADDVGNPALKVEFKELDIGIKEAHFRFYQKDNRDEILLANGVPPYALGIAEQGSLAGSTAEELLDNYATREVEKLQTKAENQFYLVTKIFAPNYILRWNDLDISDQRAKSEIIGNYVQKQIITINEARNEIGYKSAGPAGDKIYIFSPMGPIEVLTVEQMKLFDDTAEKLIKLGNIKLKELNKNLDEVIDDIESKEIKG